MIYAKFRTNTKLFSVANQRKSCAQEIYRKGVYLSQKQHIHNLAGLKTRLIETAEKVDLPNKSKDFEHLLFNKENKDRILKFNEFIINL